MDGWMDDEWVDGLILGVSVGGRDEWWMSWIWVGERWVGR